MKSVKEYRIAAAGAERGRDIADFVLSQMRDLYPKGAYEEDPQDLRLFEQVYVRPANAVFLIAEDADGALLGTTAVRPYDGRFPELTPLLGAGPVCEIVKVYIHPNWRRKGIGSRLYAEAERTAREAGYAESYLHTSLHLPGGYSFWQSRGYLERYWEADRIAHMSKKLDES
ncbi:GNAT family N-acetyltransferase [Cohnella cellulosilytica]|uniref:GNAT family N-acetyltransferase n=1 Tax=Cohnella cellulosilytica TaxID=986710 RepID=A0ABW2FLY7_9BACL